MWGGGGNRVYTGTDLLCDGAGHVAEAAVAGELLCGGEGGVELELLHPLLLLLLHTVIDHGQVQEFKFYSQGKTKCCHKNDNTVLSVQV